MATVLRRVELGIPWRGLNTDVAPSQAGDGYAVVAHNVNLRSPIELKPRRGWTYHVPWATTIGGTLANLFPIGVEVYEGTSYSDTFGVAVMGEAATTTYLGPHVDLSSSGVSVRRRYMNMTVPNNSTTSATGVTELMARSSVVNVDGAQYGVADNSGGTLVWSVWAGKNVAAHTTGGVTVTNGSRAVVFSSAPANDVTGCFLTVTGGATGPLAGYRYSYMIESKSTSTNYVLSKPYGLAENTTNVPNAVGASTTITVHSMANLAGNVTNLPGRPGACALFRDRIFVGRSFNSAGSVVNNNRLAWTDPAYPEKWPSANTALVGDNNEVIMGLATLRDALLIFTRRRTYILTGYDEDSFSLRLLFADVGCVDARSIALYRGQCVWVGEKGVYMTDGSSRSCLSEPAPGVGIWQQMRDVLYSSGTYGNRVGAVSSAICGDSLLLCMQPTSTSSAKVPSYQYNFNTSAWSTWGNTSSSGGRQPYFVYNALGRTFALAPLQSVEVTHCWAQDAPSLANTDQYDYDWTSADASTQTIVDADVQWSDRRLGAGDTARVRGIQIEHNCHYFNATSSPRVAWAVSLDVDADVDSASLIVGNVSARYVGNTGAVKPEKYFTDRFTGSSYPVEGAVFRVRMTKTVAVHSAKVFHVSLLVDGQVTSGRIDNATL